MPVTTTEREQIRLGPVVRGRLASLRAQTRFSLGTRGLSTLILYAVVLALLSFGLDRLLILSWKTRALLLVLGGTALIALFYKRMAVPLSTPLPDDELARMVERTHPSLGWRLLSAVQFSQPSWQPGPETSHELAVDVVREAEGLARGVVFAHAVPLKPVVQTGFRGAVVLAAALFLILQFPVAANTWFQRNLLLSNEARWPQDTYLVIVTVDGRTPAELGERWAVPKGKDIEIVVGLDPASLVSPDRVYMEIEEPKTGREEEIALDKVGDDRFRTVIGRASEDFTFTVHGNDSTIGPFQVHIIRPPWIESLQLQVDPPAYTGLPTKTLKLESSNLSFPVGTRIQVMARLSKPLVGAWVAERLPGAGKDVEPTRHKGSLNEDPKRGPVSFWAPFVLEKTAQFEVDVRDVDGVGLEAPTRFTITALPDKAPRVRIELIDVGLNVTPQATIRFKITVEDDFGVDSGGLRVRATGRLIATQPDKDGKQGAEKEAPPQLLKVEALGLKGQKAGQAQGVIELGPLKLVPKMALILWGAARDNNPEDPKTGNSPSVHLRVVPAEQLLNELLRRVNELRQQLTKMIKEEKDLALGLNGNDMKTLARAPNFQRDVSRIVQRGARTIEGVVGEMRTNKLLDTGTIKRLETNVGAPLEDLHQGELQDAIKLAEAATIADAGQKSTAMKAAGASALRIAAELKRIVDRMGKIEELAEIVAQLKRIIRRQRALLKKTREKEGGQ